MRISRLLNHFAKSFERICRIFENERVKNDECFMIAPFRACTNTKKVFFFNLVYQGPYDDCILLGKRAVNVNVPNLKMKEEYSGNYPPLGLTTYGPGASL